VWFATPAIALAEGAPSQPAAGETSARGEFRKLLDTIFDPETGAELQWDRVAMRNSRSVYVFAFRVPRSRGYNLLESKRTSAVPFKGFVTVQAEALTQLSGHSARRSSQRNLRDVVQSDCFPAGVGTEPKRR
jgi:hypothetical protein